MPLGLRGTAELQLSSASLLQPSCALSPDQLAQVQLARLGLKRIVRFWRASRLADGAFAVFIAKMEKTIALSVVVTIVVFGAIYALTALKIKSARR